MFNQGTHAADRQRNADTTRVDANRAFTIRVASAHIH
ncbi:MAG: hypothetical protein RIR10_1711, partial [Planctomycetota bacterium]